MKYQLGFIGTGNMGGALAQAASKSIDTEKIILTNRTEEKAKSLALSLGCAYGTNAEAAKESRFIFLGVKPQVMADMLSGIKDILAQRKTGFVLVSMAAGMSIEKIKSFAGGDYPVIRIMPNTPVSIGKGMILCCCDSKVMPEEVEDFKKAMAFAGTVDFIDESLIDAASALSGCGPAFVYMFIEALSDGAVECGLPRNKAINFACQTLIGSAEMVLKSGKHPGELKDAVCSPKGSTIAGVHALEKNGFRNAAMDAVKSAYERTKELG